MSEPTRQEIREEMIQRISPSKRAVVEGSLGIPMAAIRIGILGVIAAFASEVFIPATFILLVLGALSRPGTKADASIYYSACGWITRDQDSDNPDA